MSNKKQWSELSPQEKKNGIIGLVIIGIMFFALVGTFTSSNRPASNSQQPQAKTEAEVKPEPEDKNPHFGDGTHIVGTDVQPGTYRTRKASEGCYFERVAGFSGELKDVIENDNTDDPTVITIADTDKGFTSRRCGMWTQDLSAITTSQTSFKDGTYIVGTDILPGTYKSSGQDGCYYSRLNGFSGELADILSNDNTDTQAIISISPTDKGFTSKRCGTWTKIE